MASRCSEGALVDEPPSHLAFLGHYLTTNDAPSDDEYQAISTYLAQPRQRLQDVSKEIRDLEDRLADMQRRKGPLVTHIQKYRVISSLIRRLPDDILREIFRRCLSTERYPVAHVAEAPLLLTIVCKRWRKIALDMQELWSKAHILVDSYEVIQPSPDDDMDDKRRVFYANIKAGEDGRYAFLRAYLGRAGSLPLYLLIYDEFSAPVPMDRIVISSALKWLLSLLPRIKSIRWLPRPNAAEYLGTFPVEAFSELEELKTHWRNYYGVHLGGELPPVCLALKLRDVELWGSPTRLSKPLRWSQLTGLSIHYKWFEKDNYVPDIPFVVELLSACSKLQTLMMTLKGVQSTTSDDASLIPRGADARLPLASLWSLRLYHWGDIDGFLKMLYVPKLSELCLHGYDTYPGSSTSLPVFVDSHGYCLSSIERLDIIAQGYSHLTLVKCLDQLPCLRHLVILDPPTTHRQSEYVEEQDWIGFCEDLLVRMTPRKPEINPPSGNSEDIPITSPRGFPCLCPSLQRFEFYECENYRLNRHLTLDTVVRFVAGKWDVSQQYPDLVSRLRYITVPTRTLPEKKVSRGLKEWREKTGLVVKIAHQFMDVSRRLPRFEDQD
ncbi:hypothetical protein EST38_g8266 [Candolleomyces aberdarensis]|uniref:F-box domain-containing protein n=1 Tax=Candolleomyces aberdarensis TaxID=2316362 RepID=A0A4Q2DGD6_9AGAR|nr:hypothetical protein EST38_g8266 [Candolleomyces aberdarensis]